MSDRPLMTSFPVLCLSLSEFRRLKFLDEEIQIRIIFSLVQHDGTETVTAEFCGIKQHSEVVCGTLQYFAVLCSTLQFSALLCGTLKYFAALCSTLQFSGVLCSTQQYSSVLSGTLQSSAALQCLLPSDPWCLLLAGARRR